MTKYQGGQSHDGVIVESIGPRHRAPVSLCRACGGVMSEAVAMSGDAPVHVGILWASRGAARSCPRAELALSSCSRCGLIVNEAFRPELADYEGLEYNNALHYSPVFSSYSDPLAAEMVERYNLQGMSVLEIGCGDGSFLKQLCQLGMSGGVGFDPACNPAAVGDDDRVELIAECYTERHSGVGADFVCCRQVLEHLEEPSLLLDTVRQAIDGRNEAVLFVEVPNAAAMLDRNAVWDVIYEHCSYFTARSLGALLGRCGFEVLRVRELYDRQFLAIEACPADFVTRSHVAEAADASGAALPLFVQHYRSAVAEWRERLAVMHAQGRCMAVWGAGARAVSFLNSVDRHRSGGSQRIDCAIDINPNKHGRFVAGSGHEIVSPEMLRRIQPDVVIVMNGIYRNEIEEMLAQSDVQAEVLCA